jgi:pimeloyl-ACP methyl ester carboxylesterase
MPLSSQLCDPHMTVRHVVYLHGFASSPDSSKATLFRREAVARGCTFACPDFNAPSFETLTVTRMLAQTADAIAAASGPVALIGSSLGAFVAVHAAEADAGQRVDRLVLLAPALDFGGNRLKQLGPHGIDEWRDRGWLTVFHYAYGGPRDVHFGLYEDAAQYDALALAVRVPTLAFQGRQDELVDTGMVTAWAARQPAVTLHVVDDGHQLRASMPFVWQTSAVFLGLSP